MSNDTTLAERMIEAREARAMTQASAANRIGIRLKTLQNWESGKTQPRANRLQMLAGVLGVPLLWLMQGDEEHDPMTDRPTRLDQLENKVERMTALQRELFQLSNEIADELSLIRKLDDEFEDLAA